MSVSDIVFDPSHHDWSGLFGVVVTVLCIALSWWALQAFRVDVFIRDPSGPRGKILQVLLAIALGYQVARFFFDYLGWSLLFQRLF